MGFVKVAVSRAVRLRECPLRELRLYFNDAYGMVWLGAGRFSTHRYFGGICNPPTPNPPLKIGYFLR